MLDAAPSSPGSFLCSSGSHIVIINIMGSASQKLVKDNGNRLCLGLLQSSSSLSLASPVRLLPMSFCWPLSMLQFRGKARRRDALCGGWRRAMTTHGDPYSITKLNSLTALPAWLAWPQVDPLSLRSPHGILFFFVHLSTLFLFLFVVSCLLVTRVGGGALVYCTVLSFENSNCYPCGLPSSATMTTDHQSFHSGFTAHSLIRLLVLYYIVMPNFKEIATSFHNPRDTEYLCNIYIHEYTVFIISCHTSDTFNGQTTMLLLLLVQSRFLWVSWKLLPKHSDQFS